VIPRPHEDLGGVLSFNKAQAAASGKAGSNGGA
jgi:hypothetical protein